MSALATWHESYGDDRRYESGRERHKEENVLAANHVPKR